jgi:flavin reductase (DIM6/NTAB) family NADH-FMN oxidoreductase RutF
VQRKDIALTDLVVPAFGVWDPGWFLLTAGENRPGGFNSMTVAWGALGYMWGRPLAVVVVRPQRYTFGFMEKNNSFSLCAFPDSCRDALSLLGSKSGRDGDKIGASGLTPVPLTQIASPGYAEAELILECRKTYFDDLDPAHFLAEFIAPNYRGDYHRMYFGQVVAAQGVARYGAGRGA